MTAEKNFTLAAAWTLLTISGWSLLHPALQADEKSTANHRHVLIGDGAIPKPTAHEEEKCPFCQWRSTWNTGCNPVLSRIPGVAQLFTPAPKCGTDGYERLGVDFEASPFGFFCAHGECGEGSNPTITFTPRPIAPPDQFIFFAQPATCACLAAGCAEAKSACSSAAACSAKEGCQVEELPAVAAAAKERCFSATACTDSETCQGSTCTVKSTCQGRAEQLIAENSALRAALDAKDELMEAHSEMLEEMIGLITEKVELQCRLAVTEKLMSERERYFTEVTELRSENSRLKSLAEAAEARHAAEKVQLEMAAENERLKLRVAELERHVDATPVSVRSAKRASGKKVR